MSTLRKSHSRMLAACWRKKSAQLCSSRRGAGSIPAPFRISQTVLARELETETDQLALNSPVSPARVLPREPHHEVPNLGSSRGPAGTAVRIRPEARDQVAMPTKQRRRRHKRRPPPRPPRQHSTEGGQQRAVSRRQHRPADLPLEHSQLVAQEQDLDLLLALRAEPKHDKLEQPPQRSVKKGKHDPARTKHGR